VLQCVAVVLRALLMAMSILNGFVCCSVLLCVAECCRVSQCVAVGPRAVLTAMSILGRFVCCSVLQCVAVCCRVWQCVAVCPRAVLTAKKFWAGLCAAVCAVEYYSCVAVRSNVLQ